MTSVRVLVLSFVVVLAAPLFAPLLAECTIKRCPNPTPAELAMMLAQQDPEWVIIDAYERAYATAWCEDGRDCDKAMLDSQLQLVGVRNLIVFYEAEGKISHRFARSWIRH